MVPEVGIAPTSPPLQGGANLPQLLGVNMVVPAGNAPTSPGYQPGALLLSYRTESESRGARFGCLSRLVLWSIDERHVAHCVSFRLGVHRDPMPVTQGDRGMVRMTDSASCIHTGITAQGLPRPLRSFPILLAHPMMLHFAHAVRILGTHINE